MSDVDGERIAAELAVIRKLITAMGAKVAVAALSFEDAAQMLSCSPRHIGRMVKRGILRPREIGGLRRIPVSQIHALLEEPEGGPEPVAKRGFDPTAFSAKLKQLRKGR